jgi:DNA-binding SARP family transcriptional activator/Tfp pilus assembly protein PilF
MRYQVLGSIELSSGDGPVRLGGPKQRAVLALLLLNANRVVPERQFLAMVWGDDPPLSVRGQLQMYVSQLRKLIGEPVIVLRPPGYLIQVRPGELDLEVFDEAVRRARADLAVGRTEEALAGFRAALALWHGPALGGVTRSLLAREGPVLSDRRLSALEEYFDARLAAGRYATLVQEVREAAEENPFRERLRAQLMVALHRSGRTAEALEVYAATRSLLVAEKGVEPGPLLRETQLRLLRDEDQDDDQQVRTARSAAPTVPVPRQLPADLSVFAGRYAELARLDALLPADGGAAALVVVIAGGAGVGKTTLAVHWAHQVKDRFPDGQLYVNLRGVDLGGHAMAPDQAIRGFLSAWGVPATQIPVSTDAMVSLYRSLLADQRLLIVLDNARDAEQVRPLLAGPPGCLTVVTSRDQLGSLIATDGAMPVMLGPLSPDEAREMLIRRLDPARVDAEPAAVDDIGALCALLPLALAIVAARADANPSTSLSALADELRVAGGSLDVFDSVRRVFSWSYLALSEPAARLFRLLGLHPGPHVTTAAAASLLGVPVREARVSLAELARANLITEFSPGRYGFHDLLRTYASELVAAEEPARLRREAIHRMLDHYLHGADRAARSMCVQRGPSVVLPPMRDGVTVGAERPRLADAMDWFEAEHAVVHAVIEQAARNGFDVHAWQLIDTLMCTLWHSGARWLGESDMYQATLAAARRLADPVGLGLTHHAFAAFCMAHDRFDDAETEATTALELFEKAGDIGLQADVHQGLAKLCQVMGRHDDQRVHTEQALELYTAMGHQIGIANSYNNLAWVVSTALGDHEQAITLCKQALEMFEHHHAPNHTNEATSWDTLGYANLRLGHPEEAIACYQRAVELHRRTNKRFHEAETHRQIGDIHNERGATAQAREAWQQALNIVVELRLSSRADLIRERLARSAAQIS